MSISVKTAVYAAFEMKAHGATLTHQQIADYVCEIIPTAHTSARSVASMYVDYKKGGGVSATSEHRGEVKRIVERLLAQGGMKHDDVAAEVRRLVPGAQTTGRSVASMAVDWRRAGGRADDGRSWGAEFAQF
jgi:hypothetical protein